MSDPRRRAWEEWIGSIREAQFPREDDESFAVHQCLEENTEGVYVAFNAGWDAAMKEVRTHLSNQGLSQAYLGDEEP